MSQGKTIRDRVSQYGPEVEKRLAPLFRKAGVPYPPPKLAFLGFKSEKRLEVYAGDSASSMKFIASYPILAASGGPGPKVREGDQQVPEGLYEIDYLNPNSLYHLSLHVTYPNSVDLARAKQEGRTRLGGDIMIHGNQVSIGCLAMGDEAAEDLFVLAALNGKEKIQVILSPVDFRTTGSGFELPEDPFVKTLYQSIRRELARFPPGRVNE